MLVIRVKQSGLEAPEAAASFKTCGSDRFGKVDVRRD